MLSVFTLFCCFQQEEFECNLWEIIGVLNFFTLNVRSIAQFLYKYIKADTQKNTSLESKPAEEIPRIFKMLGYVGKAKIKEEFSLFPSQGSYNTISENYCINYIYSTLTSINFFCSSVIHLQFQRVTCTLLEVLTLGPWYSVLYAGLLNLSRLIIIVKLFWIWCILP